QTFELGGRGLRISAARTRGEAAENEIAQLRLDVARDTRLAFYELLAAQRSVERLGRWGERIREGSATIEALQRGGEVSGYDRRRAERERLTVDARLRTERARLAGARERLAALTGLDPGDLTASGQLLPDDAPDLATLLQALEARPDIRAEALRAEAAGLERRAAGRWWLPSTELTAGQKTLGDSSEGTVLGVALSIPLFDRNQAAGLTAGADERATKARREILVARAIGEVRARAAEERELRESAVAFRESASASSEALVEIAVVAYRAGEVGILELLDAFRSAIDTDTELIDLELRARIAAIELHHAAGTDAGPSPVMETK
ncbi:MAG: TolC family protein, partial [Thermoanaerobaculia bacterium]|nr:TolC family protein [Thermoanaerobaculia bacterium]